MDEKLYRKTFSNIPTLTTERLVLKQITMEHLYDMYDYSTRNEVARYLSWSPHINIAETRGYIEFLRKQYRKGLCTDWGITLKENGTLIGTCGFSAVDTKIDIAVCLLRAASI